MKLALINQAKRTNYAKYHWPRPGERKHYIRFSAAILHTSIHASTRLNSVMQGFGWSRAPVLMDFMSLTDACLRRVVALEIGSVEACAEFKQKNKNKDRGLLDER